MIGFTTDTISEEYWKENVFERGWGFWLKILLRNLNIYFHKLGWSEYYPKTDMFTGQI